MHDVWTAIGVVMVVGGVTIAAVIVAKLLMDAWDSYHREKLRLERTLRKLGWEKSDYDLWRNRKTGIVMAFQDAVTRELQATVRIKRIFPGKEFKDP